MLWAIFSEIKMKRSTREPEDRYYHEEGESAWDGEERRRDQFHYYPEHHREIPDAANTTLTVKEVAAGFVVILSMIFGGVGIWTNLNAEILTQKLVLTSMKDDFTKEIVNIKAEIKELKTKDGARSEEHKKDIDDIERRMRDLDSTVTQLFQTITKNKK
jgi:hypothetical protein